MEINYTDLKSSLDKRLLAGLLWGMSISLMLSGAFIFFILPLNTIIILCSALLSLFVFFVGLNTYLQSQKLTGGI
jgi:hypothetical protein